MSFFTDETWAWFKTAPLPVVLSMCCSSFVLLGSYAWSIDNEVKAQKAAVVVAAEKAKDAAETARRMEEKLDKLLEAVVEIRVEKKADEKAKKEKK